jgi:hypothetical protein
MECTSEVDQRFPGAPLVGWSLSNYNRQYYYYRTRKLGYW